MKQGIRVAFIVASCLELAMGIWQYSQFTLADLSLIRYLLWGFLLIYVFMMLQNTYTIKEKLLFFIMMVFGVILYFKTGINTGIKAPVYIMAIKGGDCRYLAKSFLITIVGSVCIIVMYALLAAQDALWLSDVRSNRGFHGMRFCLGFSNPNLIQIVLFAALTFAFLLYGRSMRSRSLLAILIVYFGITYLTDSQTGFIVGAFVTVGLIVVRKITWSRISDVCLFVFAAGISGMLLISILAAANIEKGFWMNHINDFISGRMNQLELYTNTESYALPYIWNWHLFSARENKNWYDLGYIQLFYYYGTVLGCCYLAFVCFVVRKAWIRKDSLGILLITGLCIYLFMEARYFSNYLTSDYLLMVSALVLKGITLETDLRGNYEEAIHKHIQSDYSN